MTALASRSASSSASGDQNAAPSAATIRAFLRLMVAGGQRVGHQQRWHPAGQDLGHRTSRPRHHRVGSGQRQGEVVQEREGLVVRVRARVSRAPRATIGYSRSPVT